MSPTPSPPSPVSVWTRTAAVFVGTTLPSLCVASNFPIADGSGPLGMVVAGVLLVVIAIPWLFLLLSPRRYRLGFVAVLGASLLACAIYVPFNGRPPFFPKLLHVDDIVFILAGLALHLLAPIAYALCPRRRD